MSTAELDKKLKELLKLMVSRLPADKKLSAPVVQQLLRVKYAEIYPEAYIAAQAAFITEQLALLMTAREQAANAAAEARDSSSSESDDSDDEEDDEEDEGDDEEEDDEDDEEDDDDEESLVEDDDDEEEEDEEGQPDRKKARLEEEKAFSGKSGESVVDRCKAMVDCLKKLSYRVRLPGDDEPLEDYLTKYLVEEFKAHKMDPESYDKVAVRRYKLAKEVELLQRDGGNVGLDRRARAGRGFTTEDDLRAVSGSSSAPTTQSSFKTSKFLDEE